MDSLCNRFTVKVVAITLCSIKKTEQEVKSMNEFLRRFSKHDYVNNDHKVAQMLKKLIEKELEWNQVCKMKHHHDTSRCGVRHLV